MIATIKVTEKSFGPTVLYNDLQLTIQKGEKLALIGRNGVGKSTLFALLTGEDKDFSGELTLRKGTVVASTRQEHHDVAGLTAVSYILGELPEYARLKHVIETYPAHMGDDTQKISRFTDALERFGQLGFYHVEDEVRTTLADYQLADKADSPLGSLSGGERRFVELVKLTHARADLLLIDEPTNHMDFVAKQRFIQWLKAAPQAVVVITHDRDVLAGVDRIVEIIDGQARSFNGNYNAYLSQNSTTTVEQIKNYETAQRTLEHLDKQIAWARARKPTAAVSGGKRNPFVVLEMRLQKQKQAILEALQKPSFWVDKESLNELDDKVAEKYHKYKAKNINLATKAPAEHRGWSLLSAENVSLGYSATLFSGLNFVIKPGDRLELRGRNGAGKSTLITAIVESAAGKVPPTLLTGTITIDKKCRIGRYEQEIDAKYLQNTLGQAVEAIYRELGLPIVEQDILRVLSNYLFDPQLDRNKQVSILSGGQKARLQLIRMFAGNPNLLILDEPTNHLDLPSIEELENALANYKGAMLYVSHDSYFRKNIGGEVVEVGAGV
jgi:ATPase subunit of ABC transporter with duplicated ATPase domains